MIELPESNTLASQITRTLPGKSIISVIAAASPHKFTWYSGDPAEYEQRLIGSQFLSARGMGMFVEIILSKANLLFNDGVNLRLHDSEKDIPKKHQLLLGLDDGAFLSASVAMYGGVQCWDRDVEFDNYYYNTAKEKPSPLVDAFDEAYFIKLLSPDSVQKLSLKGALATEQRIPGLGNGSLQDILWYAGLNPKSKMHKLSDENMQSLFTNLKQTLAKMTRLGGRSTEKDFFGNPGGYQVVMCAGTKGKPCSNCGTPILKEAYMGGSIYTCSHCQPIA